MPTIARTVNNVKCGHCGHVFNAFIAESTGWVCTCTECGKQCDPNVRPSARSHYYGNRRFAGTECQSIAQGFHPKEVNRARKLMPEVQHCIKDNGRVEFADRSEERRFRRSLSETERRLRDG